jgi:2-(1,2-epoxy-1,2-dihydrophenyl)acetyl-CoA isomerase
MSEVTYEQRGAVGIITINRPEALNALNRALRLGLIAALDRAAGAAEVRVVVLHGAGRGFGAGLDLRDVRRDRESIRQMVADEFNPGILRIAEMPKPVIGAVHGFASGISAGYVLACDLVVMGEQAFLQLPFASIGLIPDGGLCWQLARRLGHQLAFQLFADTEKLDATRCLQLGLANKLVPDADAFAAALGWAERLAQKAPLALRYGKQAMRAAPAARLDEIMALEMQLQQECGVSDDASEGIRAFLEKRTPRFQGH